MLGVPSALSRAISVLCCMEGGMTSLGVQTLLLGLTGKRFSSGEGGGEVWTSRADRNHRCVPLDCNREQDRREMVKWVSNVVWMERG